MEGATSWEYFWKITIPYISPQILTCLVYTVVDSFVDPGNQVMEIVIGKANQWEHGYMAAMAWDASAFSWGCQVRYLVTSGSWAQFRNMASPSSARKGRRINRSVSSCLVPP